jgi:hypothetical protein
MKSLSDMIFNCTRSLSQLLICVTGHHVVLLIGTCPVTAALIRHVDYIRVARDSTRIRKDQFQVVTAAI